MTVRDVLRRATASLRPHSPSATLDAELLLAHVLGRGWSRERLMSYPEAKITAAARRRFAALAGRRRRGEPVAYLRGHVEFYGLDLRVTPNVLIPRPESEALVEAVLAAVPANRAVTIADIGTGSGNLAVAIAKYRPTATVYATDRSAAALRVARRNARRNLSAVYHDRNKQPTVHFRLGDLLQPLAGTHLDVVVANLPYLPDAVYRRERQRLHFEPALALRSGADGLNHYRRLLAQLAARPQRPRHVVLEAEATQVPALRSLVRSTLPYVVFSHTVVNGVAIVRLTPKVTHRRKNRR